MEKKGGNGTREEQGHRAQKVKSGQRRKDQELEGVLGGYKRGQEPWLA